MTKDVSLTSLMRRLRVNFPLKEKMIIIKIKIKIPDIDGQTNNPKFFAVIAN